MAKVWWLIVFLGTLPLGSALQYYFSGEGYRNSATRNWLVVAQGALGVAIIVFAVYRAIKAGRASDTPDQDDKPLDLR